MLKCCPTFENDGFLSWKCEWLNAFFFAHQTSIMQKWKNRNYHVWTIPHICHFFTQAKFLENKIYTEKTRKLRQNTKKIANFLRYYGKIHSKLPIFRVKSVKIYTGPKKFTRTCSWGSWQISGMWYLHWSWGQFIFCTFADWWYSLVVAFFKNKDFAAFFVWFIPTVWNLVTSFCHTNTLAIIARKVAIFAPWHLEVNFIWIALFVATFITENCPSVFP